MLRLVVDHVHRYQKIGVFIGDRPSQDHISAAVAMAAACAALGKSVTLVGPEHVPALGVALPFADQIAPLRIDTSHLVVQLDTTATALAELSYETEPGKVKIFLRPKEGSFSPQDITVQAAEFPFDLIMLCGVQRPEQLGPVFTDNVELFYSLPRINIDVHPANETYGTINIVSVSASSVSELVFRVLVAVDEVVAVPPAATALLYGVMQATERLQGERTTPETFAVVADLVAAGAQYRSVASVPAAPPRLSLVQLYGRILARLREVRSGQGLYALVQSHDLEKTGEQAVDAETMFGLVVRDVPAVRVLTLAVPTAEEIQVHVLTVRACGERELREAFSTDAPWEVRPVGSGWSYARARLTPGQSVQALEQLLAVGTDRLLVVLAE